jgi:hypothetical protein
MPPAAGLGVVAAGAGAGAGAGAAAGAGVGAACVVVGGGGGGVVCGGVVATGAGVVAAVVCGLAAWWVWWGLDLCFGFWGGLLATVWVVVVFGVDAAGFEEEAEPQPAATTATSAVASGSLSRVIVLKDAAPGGLLPGNPSSRFGALKSAKCT